MRVFLFLASLLPLKSAKKIIRGLMALLPFQRLEAYKITLINISISFPNLSTDEKESLAKRSFVETACSFYETLYSLSRSPKKISQNILRVDNKYLMSQPLRAEGGLIISGIHNRSVDMLLQWINSQTPTVGIYKPIKNKIADAHVKKHREQLKSKVYSTSYKGVKELFKAINKNKVIIMASDQVPQDGMGEYANFFGREAYTTTLIPSLANKTRKPLLYIGLFSASENSLKISCKEAPEETSIQSMNKTMQEMILNCPEDYSWEYKRFKKPPENLDYPY
tara:strand:+ start:3087 stop:3926 length:840 start_codon:yes stop_codon:yes gene_type:complete